MRTSTYGAVSRTVGQVKQYLQGLQGSVEQLKSDIQQLVNAMIAKRKQERGTHSQIVAGLKIPIRQAPPPAAASSVTSAPTKKQEEEWDVFISHAGRPRHHRPHRTVLPPWPTPHGPPRRCPRRRTR